MDALAPGATAVWHLVCSEHTMTTLEQNDNRTWCALVQQNVGPGKCSAHTVTVQGYPCMLHPATCARNAKGAIVVC